VTGDSLIRGETRHLVAECPPGGCCDDFECSNCIRCPGGPQPLPSKPNSANRHLDKTVNVNGVAHCLSGGIGYPCTAKGVDCGDYRLISGIRVYPTGQDCTVPNGVGTTSQGEPMVTTDIVEGTLPDGTKQTEEAIVEGTVWLKGAGGAKKVVVKLVRLADAASVQAVVKTTTASDGSYKFSVKGSAEYLSGEFYIKVRLPEGREFTTSKSRPSNVSRKTGRSKYFRVKPGEPVIQNAYIQTPKLSPVRLVGYLFEDTNGNGEQDVGEPSIPNFDVEIPTDISGNSLTVTTDDNGQCEATLPAVPTSLPRQSGPTVVTVSPVACTMKVCALVFENPNGSPCKDPGKPGIPDVDMTFTYSYDIPPVVSFTTTLSTDLNGMVCILLPSNNLWNGPTKVTVDIDGGTLPGSFIQYLGDNPTTHMVSCNAFPHTVWDSNGFFMR